MCVCARSLCLYKANRRFDLFMHLDVKAVELFRPVQSKFGDAIIRRKNNRLEIHD